MAITARSSAARGYSVWRADVQDGKVGQFRHDPLLIAQEASLDMAPNVHRAKVQVDLSRGVVPPWRWRERVFFDQAIRICSNHPKPADREVWFEGFVADCDWGFGRDDAHAIATAVGYADRLNDQVCYGRWMASAAGTPTLYSGLPLTFNAGGKPNRSATTWTVPGSPVGAPTPHLFTYDGDPAAEMWNHADAFEYLQWAYNPAQAWLTNILFTDAARDALRAAGEIMLDGSNLWNALAAVARAAGWHLWESIFNDGSGAATHAIAALRYNSGPAVQVAHQELNDDGSFPTLDVAETNLYTFNAAESVASCVPAPVVAGGRRIAELTVRLYPAWDPAGLPAANSYEFQYMETDYATGTFAKRYCTKGPEFRDYRDVGRLWDANTDGRYSAAPYSQPATDLSLLIDEIAGAWPAMPHAPLTPLSRDAAGKTLGALPEISLDSGVTWYPLSCQIDRDRLAVWISAENIQSMLFGEDEFGDPSFTDGLMYYLVNSPANTVRVRLTCSIACPDRKIAAPARRQGAGTQFTRRRWFDRGQLGQVRTRLPAGAYQGAADTATDADGQAAVDAAAEQIADALEDRMIEASVPVEWPEPGIRLGDQVVRIKGVNYDLSVNGGPAKRGADVVGVRAYFTPETYATVLVLDSMRKAGVA